MNLTKLFEAQAELDKKIVEEKGLQGQDLLDKKTLALQVELGELANCWRGFKYWSHDQEPRTKVKKVCETCGGERYILISESFGFDKCSDCDGKGDFGETNPLLEEYIDCLHFILSIGLEIGVCSEELDAEPIFCANVTEQFIDLFYDVSRLRYEERNGRLYEDYYQYNIVLEHFVGLGEMLGFTWEEVEQAYYTKNKENHERQENDY